MINPLVLIISTTLDFATDRIAILLYKKNIPFLRLNRDEFDKYHIELDPISSIMNVSIEGLNYRVENSAVLAIYYRAPTFLRDIYQEGLNEEQQLFRTQWAAFMRGLIIFDLARWFNHPVDTYRAENKAYQLRIANKLGFAVPISKITNSTLAEYGANTVAVKSIDTAIVGNSSYEKFVYTQIYDLNELPREHFSSPFFIQQALVPKTDIRVTIVGDWLLAVSITAEERIGGDWRKHGLPLTYKVIDLPIDTLTRCREYVRFFNLPYCAMDLVFFDDNYYFIEINPTGEWSFIQENTAQEIDLVITKALIQND
ncbi:RimK family alpha-L-glutamate ligase [Pedobacter jeongneungensis]|uniref:ATP-grasp domain-containing protein n=1 Tax=Pedobacter jeongneungensis TaxID=947309 RepID=UPI0004696D83|nr:hypothetical protein [Pedobacter jeongneungensis]